MPGFVATVGKKRCAAAPLCVSDPIPTKRSASLSSIASLVPDPDPNPDIIPGLVDDVAKLCLALVPRSDFLSMAAVCKTWRSFLQSKEFLITRKLAGVVEEWMYLLITDADGKQRKWEVVDRAGNRQRAPPPMSCPVQTGFEVVVLDGKLYVIGGYSVVNGTKSASADVYEYNSCLNSWRKAASMNMARYDFACAEVNGSVYAVGGFGTDGESLSSAELYSPETNKWTLMEPLRRPRRGSFGFGFENKLYVMGGRSSFTIGNLRSVDIYDVEGNQWSEMKKGCVMVTCHAVIGRKLYCIEWKDQRKLAVFDPGEGTWERVNIPLTGSSGVGFRLGVLGGNLLLMSYEKAPWYATLVYDPEARKGSEWRSCRIRPSGRCVLSVTLEA